MSSEQVKSARLGIGFNTIVTILSGVVLAWLAWSNKQQLDLIALNQDKAIMQVKADAADRFVTTVRFDAEVAQSRASDRANADAIIKISDVLSELRMNVAVIKTEIQKKP